MTMHAPDPFASFRFSVEIDNNREFTGIFTELKLPDVEWDIQEMKEGGLNAFTHQLPGRRKASKVTLKNGLATKGVLMDWYANLMDEDFNKFLKTVTITLLNSEHKAVMRWNISNAYPSKLTWPELKTSDNVVAIQTLELVCGEVKLDKQV
jgi:phage tail-like protein